MILSMCVTSQVLQPITEQRVLSFTSVLRDLSSSDWFTSALMFESACLRALHPLALGYVHIDTNMGLIHALRGFIKSFLVVLLWSKCQGRESEFNYVTCGSLVKLLNTRHNVRLHSHDVKYGSGKPSS